jgi:hypothetical protein
LFYWFAVGLVQYVYGERERERERGRERGRQVGKEGREGGRERVIREVV